MTLSPPPPNVLADTLRRSDHLFQVLQEGVVLLDLGGVIIDANPASEHMFGFTKREIVGRRPAMLQEPDAEVSLSRAVQEALVTGRWEGEMPFRRKDGTTGTAEVIVSVPPDAAGNPLGVISVHRDVSERRLVEEALTDTEARFHLMFDANPIPMWVYDTETLRFLEVNASAVASYGFTRTEFLGMTLADIRPQSEISALRDIIEEDVRGDYRRRQIVHRRKDGTEFVASVIGCNINYVGRVARLVTSQDVSAQVHLREALERSEQMLRAAQQQLGSAPALGDGTASQDGASSRKTILLVEDDPAVRSTIGRMLRKAGYVIIEAANGDDALVQWKEQQLNIDIVMSDAVMPGLRGVELLRQLRRERPSLPVLLVSGYLADRWGDAGLDGENIPILEKPFTAASLIARLESLIV